jgi:peptide subunit release factor 1 (eRF1)
MQTQQVIEQLRTKRTIQQLKAAEGSGTSMISLYIPSNAHARVTKLLKDEYAVSANIKSRV